MSYNTELYATSSGYGDLPPPPSYDSSVSYASATTFDNNYGSRFTDPMSSGAAGTEDLSSNVNRLEKRLEVCETKLQENEIEMRNVKEEHKREINELQKQINDLKGGSHTTSSPAAATAVSTPVYSFPGTKIALQGHHKKYISAQPDGRVECNRKNLDIWETVTIEKEGDRTVYLKSYHGKYLSAQPDGCLQWNRDRKGPWERFEVYQVPANKIALKSCHGKWVFPPTNKSLRY